MKKLGVFKNFGLYSQNCQRMGGKEKKTKIDTTIIFRYDQTIQSEDSTEFRQLALIFIAFLEIK